MNLVSIPADAPFLDTLAARWLAQAGELTARGLILLPTRRAARALAEAFLRQSGGRPLLLPRITALGALDEAPLTLAGALDLPQAVEPAERLAVLSRLILALPEESGGARSADRAWMLAQELALLMDEAERSELDLAEALPRAAAVEHAAHWQITLDFLGIVTRAWPAWLAEQGLMNPASRQIRLLRAQALAWQLQAPDEPVWVAGTTGGVPAVAGLLRCVAGLPNGLVVLPGLDFGLDEAVWDKLDEAHPQAGLQRLLHGLGAARGDVEPWARPGGRVTLLSRALLPAEALREWRQNDAPDTHILDTGGLRRLEAADPQEEAVAIALILRGALERPGARAALVTPDRALAGRVAAELLRWGVIADDSAGEPLIQTPPAVFLRLLAAAVAGGLAPVQLLALLGHPFAAAGLSPLACRQAARLLEIDCLRGPRPPAGLTGLRHAAAEAAPAATALLDRLETCLAPLLRIAAGMVVAPSEALAALIEAAEALATTDAVSGPGRLWALEEGEALAAHLTRALAALRHLPDQPPACLPGLLDALLEGEVVRSRRALRGRDNASEHPRVFIWGLLEARLQAVDVVVLGGLTEGVWPPATDPGPWLSRPMRAQAGLPSPEERIGQAAHDFVMACCAAPDAILSCPRRRDGAPAVPSRWLARIDALLAGRQRRLDRHQAAGWARLLDQPAGPPRPASPPRPLPAVALRPRKLSVTEIQTWLEDPYAIYARHVLKLRKLKPLEEETDAADYGSLVHDGIRLFLARAGHRWPADARTLLCEAMDRALQEARLRPALTAWWRPRLRRIADWVAEQETLRRSRVAPVAIAGEVQGEWSLEVPGGFLLRGRADRIEKRPDGSLAILDYKTGAPPSQEAVRAGFAPQLPLEAAMAAAGGFGAELRGQAGELTYWHLTGGFEPGEERSMLKADADAIADATATARQALIDLIAAYDDENRPYLSQPHPGRLPRFSDYATLARVAEWDLSGDGE
jgi:ATP-dependent helicase/nuclease subunit B